jgi:hypothetical protein
MFLYKLTVQKYLQLVSVLALYNQERTPLVSFLLRSTSGM